MDDHQRQVAQGDDTGVQLDYARRGLPRRQRDPMERGLSNGRMAFLLMLVGLPLSPFLIGLPIVAISLGLAIWAINDSQKRSVFGWIVAISVGLLAFSIVCVAIWDKIFGGVR